MGQKQKTEKKKREKERERKLVITMAKLRMAHASTHGARKPPGPTIISFVQPQPNSIQNKSNPIGCGTAPGNLVYG